MPKSGTGVLYLRRKIERSGRTQAQLAAELGVNTATFCQYVSGRKMPSAAKLPALAAALGCTVDALYREEVTEDAED